MLRRDPGRSALAVHSCPMTALTGQTLGQALPADPLVRVDGSPGRLGRRVRALRGPVGGRDRSASGVARTVALLVGSRHGVVEPAGPEPPGHPRQARQDARRRRRLSRSEPDPPGHRRPQPRRGPLLYASSTRPNQRIGTPMKYVYAFREGSREQKFLLGGKGANLAEMTNLGLPVPPGFTISTDACKAYMAGGDTHARRPDGRGRRRRSPRSRPTWASASATTPTRCSSRCVRAPPFSMPGMMDTVLNLGLNDDSVQGLAQADRQRAVRVRLVPALRADVRQDRARRPRRRLRGGAARPHGGARRHRRHRAVAPRTSAASSRRSRRSSPRSSGVEFPDDPHGAARRTRSRRCSSRGTVAGPRTTGGWSASPTTSAPRSTCRRWCTATRATTPAPASRSPATRRRARARRTATSSPTRRARTSSRASGSPSRSTRWADTFPECHVQLLEVMDGLENHYRDMCDIEFTIEQGRLFILQTRVGKRTAVAALRMAVEMESEGLIDKREAVLRVQPAQLDQLLHPQFDPKATYDVHGQGAQRVARRGRRQGVLHRRRRRSGRGRGRDRDPRAAGDVARGPARHDRGRGHPHVARRAGVATRRSSRAAWARRRSAVPTRCTSTSPARSSRVTRRPRGRWRGRRGHDHRPRRRGHLDQRQHRRGRRRRGARS